MSTRKKLGAIIGGSLVGLGAVGLGVYFLVARKSKVKIVKSEEDKAKLIEILDELMFEYAPILTTFCGIFRTTEKIPDQFHREFEHSNRVGDLKKIIASHNEKVCERFNITTDYLVEWITAYNKDSIITQKQLNFQNALDNVMEGKFPEFFFDVPEELDEEMYEKVYKRIVGYNLHLYYINIQARLKSPNRIQNKEQLGEMLKELEPERLENVDKICLNSGIPRGEKYEDMLRKAYYCYIKDDHFRQRTDETNLVYSEALTKVLNEKDEEILAQNPKDFPQKQFEDFWNELSLLSITLSTQETEQKNTARSLNTDEN